MPHFKLKIALDNAPVKIERVILLTQDVNFLQLHLIIQEAMGWLNAHLFEFCDKKTNDATFKIGIDDEEPIMGGRKSVLAHKVMLSTIAKNNMKFLYWYDFGDDWWHKVTFQKITKKDADLLKEMQQKKQVCHLIKARGACPPEDCGGVWGYSNLLQALSDPKHPEHEEFKEWLGLESDETFDPELVFPEETNAILHKIHKTEEWNEKL